MPGLPNVLACVKYYVKVGGLSLRCTYGEIKPEEQSSSQSIKAPVSANLTARRVVTCRATPAGLIESLKRRKTCALDLAKTPT